MAITPNGQYLYVADTDSGNVSIISTFNNTIVYAFDKSNLPLGVTAAPNGRYVYVADSGSGMVSVLSTPILISTGIPLLYIIVIVVLIALIVVIYYRASTRKVGT